MGLLALLLALTASSQEIGLTDAYEAWPDTLVVVLGFDARDRIRALCEAEQVDCRLHRLGDEEPEDIELIAYNLMRWRKSSCVLVAHPQTPTFTRVGCGEPVPKPPGRSAAPRFGSDTHLARARSRQHWGVFGAFLPAVGFGTGLGLGLGCAFTPMSQAASGDMCLTTFVIPTGLGLLAAPPVTLASTASASRNLRQAGYRVSRAPLGLGLAGAAAFGLGMATASGPLIGAGLGAAYVGGLVQLGVNAHVLGAANRRRRDARAD